MSCFAKFFTIFSASSLQCKGTTLGTAWYSGFTLFSSGTRLILIGAPFIYQPLFRCSQKTVLYLLHIFNTSVSRLAGNSGSSSGSPRPSTSSRPSGSSLTVMVILCIDTFPNLQFLSCTLVDTRVAACLVFLSLS